MKPGKSSLEDLLNLPKDVPKSFGVSEMITLNGTDYLGRWVHYRGVHDIIPATHGKENEVLITGDKTTLFYGELIVDRANYGNLQPINLVLLGSGFGDEANYKVHFDHYDYKLESGLCLFSFINFDYQRNDTMYYRFNGYILEELKKKY